MALLMNPETAAALSLLSAQAVRTRARTMLTLGLEDRLPNFRIDLTRLDAIADRVLTVTRQAYPSLDVPFHSRWRHFVVNGTDRFAATASQTSGRNAAARAEFDLAIVSVFLDAGAGAQWRYSDPVSGQAIGRSEGLALASLDMFAAGAFSADPKDPLRVDAAVLAELTADRLAKGFQVTADNPLVGLDGRAALLRRLGALVREKPGVFARDDSARPGGLFDHMIAQSGGTETIAAPQILAALLLELGPIWPSRLSLGGVPLGDCWRHGSIETADATNGLVPLHKLSQWLSYSLIEPLQRAGLIVSDIDGLTGLAEYRNRNRRLADFLPWAALVGTGIVLNKDGSFQRTASFRGPDLDSAVPAELVAVAGRLNNAFRRLGSGWAIFVEAQRHAAG
ncbi:MAG: hypothetical protein B7Y77_01680, partial [Bradyrhizobium sp. 35-63-5]